jgi:hypothetical protein
MPKTDITAVTKGKKKNGQGKVYAVVKLTVPAQYAEHIPEKQKYQCVPSDDGVLVFIPVNEDE